MFEVRFICAQLTHNILLLLFFVNTSMTSNTKKLHVMYLRGMTTGSFYSYYVDMPVPPAFRIIGSSAKIRCASEITGKNRSFTETT